MKELYNTNDLLKDNGDVWQILWNTNSWIYKEKTVEVKRYLNQSLSFYKAKITSVIKVSNGSYLTLVKYNNKKYIMDIGNKYELFEGETLKHFILRIKRETIEAQESHRKWLQRVSTRQAQRFDKNPNFQNTMRCEKLIHLS